MHLSLPNSEDAAKAKAKKETTRTSRHNSKENTKTRPSKRLYDDNRQKGEDETETDLIDSFHDVVLFRVIRNIYRVYGDEGYDEEKTNINESKKDDTIQLHGQWKITKIQERRREKT